MNNTQILLADDEVITAPFNEVGTGLISTNKLGLIGVGTAFKSELQRGAYIIDFLNKEYRKVLSVESDTYAILDRAFQTDINRATIDYSSATGPFTVGETITGTDTGNTAAVISDDGAGQLVVQILTGDWSLPETEITGAASGSVADVDAVTLGGTMDYIPSYKGNVKEIAVIIPVYQQDNTTENTWGKIDDVDTPPGTGVNFSKANRHASGSSDVLNPIFVDATGTQALVTLTY